MATKKITHLWNATGLTVYCVIRREADGFLLNDADGAFSAAPADPYIAMTEHATLNGVYEASEARAAWSNGLYTVIIYRQTGGAPAPVSDIAIGCGQIQIAADAEVIQSGDSYSVVNHATHGNAAILEDTGTTIPAAIATIDGIVETLAASCTEARLARLDVAVSTRTTLGAGSLSFTYTVTDSVTGLPIADVTCTVSTDVAGLNMIASGITDQNGVVTFALDAGTIYVWRYKTGYTFTNPDTEVVS
jgi:hypothetical protein